MGYAQKSIEDIGIEYELYVGALYEAEGYKVNYNGIRETINDAGRDLICKKGNKVLIIQCKCYSSKKQIFENVVNQLYGTTEKYRLENGLAKEYVTPVIVTSTVMSESGREFAKTLGVQIRENIKYNLDDFVKLRIKAIKNYKISGELVASYNTNDEFSGKLLDAENRIKNAIIKQEEAELKERQALARAIQAESKFKQAISDKTEAENLAKKYKSVQLASLERSKKLMDELENLKLSSQKEIKKEYEARIKAEKKTRELLKKIATEVASATARVEAEAEAKIKAVKFAAEAENRVAKAKVIAAETDKLAAESLAKAAEASKQAEEKKSQKAYEEAQKMSALAKEAAISAEKARKELKFKTEEAAKALAFSKAAEEKIHEAEVAKEEAESRADIAEKQLKIAIKDSDELRKMIANKEVELKEIFKEELHRRDSLKLKELGLANPENTFSLENICDGRDLDNSSCRFKVDDNEYSSIEFDRVISNYNYCKEGTQNLKDNNLDLYYEHQRESKVLSKKIKLNITKITYYRNDLNVYIRVKNENCSDVIIGNLVMDIKLYFKYSGIKIFEKLYKIEGIILEQGKLLKTKIKIKNIKICDLDDNLHKKAIDWQNSNIICENVCVKKQI